MPRRRYYSVTVTGEGNVKKAYTGEAAEKIVEFIKDEGLEPDNTPKEQED